MASHPQKPPTPRAKRESALTHTIDRRQSERHAADGEVVLLPESPQLVELRGNLLDVSETGFRVGHNCMTLASGQIVAFVHATGCGKARVVWNRVHGQSVETGFVILPHSL